MKLQHKKSDFIQLEKFRKFHNGPKPCSYCSADKTDISSFFLVEN